MYYKLIIINFGHTSTRGLLVIPYFTSKLDYDLIMIIYVIITNLQHVYAELPWLYQCQTIKFNYSMC